jgi:hypothetical protein
MYVRFETYQRHCDSHSPQGVFQAAYRLRECNELPEYEQDWLGSDLNWLEMHLKIPTILRMPGHRRAICWFHPRAARPISKVRSIVLLLEEHGVRIRMVKTNKPGQIIYEDGWQIVAKPWRGRKK